MCTNAGRTIGEGCLRFQSKPTVFGRRGPRKLGGKKQGKVGKRRRKRGEKRFFSWWVLGGKLGIHHRKNGGGGGTGVGCRGGAGRKRKGRKNSGWCLKNEADRQGEGSLIEAGEVASGSNVGRGVSLEWQKEWGREKKEVWRKKTVALRVVP